MKVRNVQKLAEQGCAFIYNLHRSTNLLQLALVTSTVSFVERTNFRVDFPICDGG